MHAAGDEKGRYQVGGIFICEKRTQIARLVTASVDDVARKSPAGQGGAKSRVVRTFQMYLSRAAAIVA
jgi:hypothetical protein